MKKKMMIVISCLFLVLGTGTGEAYAKVVGSGENQINITFKGTYENKQENEGSGKKEENNTETGETKSVAAQEQRAAAKTSLPQTGEGTTGEAGGAAALAAVGLVYIKYRRK